MGVAGEVVEGHEEQRTVWSAADTDRRLDALERRVEQLATAWRIESRRRSDELDRSLQPAAFRTLKTLARLGPSSQSALLDLLEIDKSVLSRQLHQLARLGLVVRSIDVSDRRAAVVEVTPRATARLRAGRQRSRRSFRAALATWDPHEFDELIRLLEKLGRAVLPAPEQEASRAPSSGSQPAASA